MSYQNYSKPQGIGKIRDFLSIFQPRSERPWARFHLSAGLLDHNS